jgi:CRISPR-associated protein Csd1
MSWIQKLYETYEQCANIVEPIGVGLWPVSYIVKRAHVEVVLDAKGILQRIRKLNPSEFDTLIPVTEDSANRTNGIAPHPLCEEVSYCAPDKLSSERFAAYVNLLASWCNSAHAHLKAQAVLCYVKKQTLRGDLANNSVFPFIFKKKQGQKETTEKVDDDKVFVRWSIEDVNNPCSGTWQDAGLIQAWQAFDRDVHPENGICVVTGRSSRIGKKHPRFVRYSGDGGKLISSNDDAGYTYRGRFTDGKDDYGKQTCTVGFDVSQKAHHALRWLIKRQGYSKDNQAIVSWAISGEPLPDLTKNTLAAFDIETADIVESQTTVNTDQAFALRLKEAIAGYGTKLDPSKDGSTDYCVEAGQVPRSKKVLRFCSFQNF